MLQITVHNKKKLQKKIKNKDNIIILMIPPTK
jgi:hypothetical protein